MKIIEVISELQNYNTELMNSLRKESITKESVITVNVIDAGLDLYQSLTIAEVEQMPDCVKRAWVHGMFLNKMRQEGKH